MGKLKDFANQYDKHEVAGYTYRECPRPLFEFLDAADWQPEDDKRADVQKHIEQYDKLRSYGYYYNKLNRKHYVIDHLWLAMLIVWGGKEMEEYMEVIYGRMLKPAKKKRKSKKKEFFEHVTSNDTNKDLFGNEVEPTRKKKEQSVSLLDKKITETQEEMFLEKYGISKKAYDGLKDTKHIVIPTMGSELIFTVTFCKFIYKHLKVGMNNLYDALKKRNIIKQIDKDNINLLDDTLGITSKYKEGKSYPAWNRKGVIALAFIMVDEGLTDTYVIPD